MNDFINLKWEACDARDAERDSPSCSTRRYFRKYAVLKNEDAAALLGKKCHPKPWKTGRERLN